MFHTDNEKVFIEHCQGCSSHAWCTKHDESKYHSYFEACKSKIQEICPEVQVMCNQIPLAFSKKFSSHEESRPWEGTLGFPRLGSFEIYFKDRIIFSKLETGLWPHSSAVANKIREIIDKPKLPPVTRDAKTTNLTKKKKRPKFKSRNSKSIEPSSSRSIAIRGKSTTPKRNPESLSSYRKNKQKQPRVEKMEEKESDEDEYSDEFREQSLEKENEDAANSMEKREITKVYELNLPADSLSNKKINYTNKGEEICEFVVKSSDPVNMIVKESKIKILPGDNGKFQLRFPPVNKPKRKEYILTVDNKGKPWECFKFIVTYE